MRLASLVAWVLAPLWVRLGIDPETGETPARLVILNRQIAQHNSRWLVRYQVRYDGDHSLELSASDVNVDYEGWVANSRCRPHVFPRKSEAHFALSEGNPIIA